MKPQDRTRAIIRSKAEPSMRLLLVAIADRMNEDDESWPSPTLMSNETGLAESTVMLLLKEAIALGVLRRWQGDRRWKVMSIDWDRLAELTPKASPAKGGRKGPTIGGDTPNTGDQAPTVGPVQPPDSRYAPLRPSVLSPPTIGVEPSDHRTRSVHEATSEATSEAHTGERATPEGMPVDLTALLGPARHDLARRLMTYDVNTPADLLARTEADVQRIPGIGPDRVKVIARLCREAGWPLGCLAPPAPPGRGPPRSGRSSLLDQLDAATTEPDPPLRNAIDADFEVLRP